METAEHYWYVPEYQDIYKLRSETIERVFANAKEKHGIRYTQLRGLKKVTMHVALTFACMNLKKLAKWREKRENPALFFAVFPLLACVAPTSLHQVILPQKGTLCAA